MYTLRRGFTLIELLVVIMIIGLLTGVATTSFLNAQRNARDSARKSSTNAIAGAVETYRTAKGKYPGITREVEVGEPPSVPGCVGVFGGEFVYYYKPGVNCSEKADIPSAQAPHTKADFAPAPNWIPGLSPYLNPLVTEKRYMDKDAGDNGDPNFNSDGQPIGNTRTYSYHRSSNGFAVYTVLENSTPGIYKRDK